MHGDGLCHRWVPWPDLDPSLKTPGVQWIRVVGRRFWCPTCGHSVRVHHPGIDRGVAFGSVVVAMLFWLAGAKPLGKAFDEQAIYELVQGQLSESERLRTGKPRWYSLHRWALAVSSRWPTLLRRAGSWRTGVEAALLAFAPGGDLEAVLLAALRGGFAM